jgi:hypothetical protein
MRSPSPSPGVRELLHEKLDALLADCDKITNNAAYGRTIHDLDDFLFIEGRKFINAVLQQKMQEQIEQIEATPESKQCPNCKKKRKRTTKFRKR